MGYRSNVGYVIVFKSPDKSVMSGAPETTNPEKAFAEFSHFLEHILGFIKNNDTHGMVSEEFKYMQIDKDKMIISYHAEDIKWYEDYPFVQWHMDLLKQVKTYETGNYRLIRIGDDLEDNEEDTHDPTAFMYDYINLRREVIIEDEGDFMTDLIEEEEQP
jgi:hypothetical protein